MNKELLIGVIVAAVAFLLIGIAVNFGPTMLEGFESTRVDTTASTETFADQSTADNNSIVVTTTYNIWEDDTGQVTSVTSNETGDTPVASSASDTSLNVTGCPTAGNPRTLTVTYNYGTVEQYTALEDVVEAGPGLILLGFIISVGIAGFMGITLAGYGAYKVIRH